MKRLIPVLALAATSIAPPIWSTDLLRNDSIATLSLRPDLSLIFTAGGSSCPFADPTVTLDATDPTCNSIVGEGSLLSTPGSSDDDDLYAWASLPSVDAEPGGVVNRINRPLIFWQLGGASSNGFRLVKSGNTVESSDAAPLPTGACCDDISGCWDGATAASCGQLYQYLLVGEVCADGPCVGKCCELSKPGLCSWTRQSLCGGPFWTTDMIGCSANRSCCLPTGCFDSTDDQCCRALGGTPGTTCATSPPCW